MKFHFIIAVFALTLLSQDVSAQLIGLGYKYQERSMFQASVNYPFDSGLDRIAGVTGGIDFTTKNRMAPSGVTLQITPYHYLFDRQLKNQGGAILIGSDLGYHLNTGQGENGFKAAPHLYVDFILVYLKIGAEYYNSTGRTYPFVSIGIGGIHGIRNLHLKW